MENLFFSTFLYSQSFQQQMCITHNLKIYNSDIFWRTEQFIKGYDKSNII